MGIELLENKTKKALGWRKKRQEENEWNKFSFCQSFSISLFAQSIWFQIISIFFFKQINFLVCNFGTFDSSFDYYSIFILDWISKISIGFLSRIPFKIENWKRMGIGIPKPNKSLMGSGFVRRCLAIAVSVGILVWLLKNWLFKIFVWFLLSILNLVRIIMSNFFFLFACLAFS